VSEALVRIAVVPNELEAEMVRSSLRIAGIESTQRYADFGAAAWDGMPTGGGPRDVLVHGDDLEAARELVDAQ
jgi:hypothetical protein